MLYYLGVKNQLPIGKINFNSKEYNNNLTTYHKVPFFKGIDNETGTSETVFLGLSSLRKALGVTTVIKDQPKDSSGKIDEGKLGRDFNSNSYTRHVFNYSSYASIPLVFVTVYRTNNDIVKSYSFALDLIQNSVTFSIKDYGLTSSDYNFSGTLDQENRTVTLTFDPKTAAGGNASVLVNCSITAIVQC